MPTNAVVYKALPCLAVAIAIGFVVAVKGAADEKPKDQWASVNVKGSDKWFTLAQLRKASDAHLLKREPKLDLRMFDVTANVHTDDQSKLVTFQYFENFGLPVFYVTLGKAGEPTSFTNRIASEKIDVTPPPSGLPTPRK